jgi:arylsulfatase A-like enzyme
MLGEMLHRLCATDSAPIAAKDAPRPTVSAFPSIGVASWIVIGIACVATLGCRDDSPAEPAAPRNLLIVTLDTVRADYVGSYLDGEADELRRNITPNLDALAEAGVRFNQAISSASVTPVSHASILTGQYPYRHGLRVLSADGGFRVEEDVPLLAEVLRDAGYRTGAFHSSFTVSGYFGFDRGFGVFDSFAGQLEGLGRFREWGAEENQRRSDVTTDLAIEFLDGDSSPFFMWVHYWDMHDPFILPPDEFMPPEDELMYNAKGVLQLNDALYAAEIRYVDLQFGRLMAALEERGLDENTLVIAISDHGEGLGDHGWRFHRLLYQEQIRVPMLIRIPGLGGGRTVDDVVRNIDVYPTALDYLGLPLPNTIDGRSLRPLIEGALDPPRSAYSDQINIFDTNAPMQRPRDALLYSIVDGGWKLIYKPLHPGHSELYDLVNDPMESKNRFNGEIARRESLLKDLAFRKPWVEQAPRGAGMDPRARERLEALGYLQSSPNQETDLIAWSYTPVDRFDREHFADRARCEEVAGSTCVLIRDPSSRPGGSENPDALETNP